ncbi:hypothetical protein CBS101457_001745 [Exobasidium rhododendri]|nr:hypothetical protein CBS101457_001745 [Exobasidium rhododendri]
MVDVFSRRVDLLAALVCFVFLSILQVCSGHMIELEASSKECFFEDLNPGDQMTLTYQVGGGGHLDIDATLTDPNHEKLFELLKKDTGTYSLTAQHTGRYDYCFSNEFSTVSDKTVSFNVHGIIYVPDDGEMLPIEREIRDLAAGLQAVKDEQEYLVIRERVHRNSE